MNTTSLLAAIVLASAVSLSGCIQEEPPGLVVMTPTPGPAPAVTPAPPPTPTAPAEEVAEPTPTPTMNITRTLCDYPPCGEDGGGSSGNVVSPPVPELCTLAMMLVGLAGLFLLKRDEPTMNLLNDQHKIGQYYKYLKYLVKHKWYVFVECCRLGIPIQGIMHDLSKFRLSEFISYAQHFYGNYLSIYDVHRMLTYDKSLSGKQQVYLFGTKPEEKVEEDFNYSWMLHQNRNKHHWQYWVLIRDEGGLVAVDMPLKYRKEMFADWVGAGRAQGHGDDVINWYRRNEDKILLHDRTESWIDLRILERRNRERD